MSLVSFESPAHARWRERALATLREAGFRSGGARAAIIDLLASQQCCLTAQEVFDHLRASGRPVGIASVYRALDLLVGLRLALRLEMGSGVARYEAALPDGEHHHHFVCRACGAVAPFADEALEVVLGELVDRLGYESDGHEIVLHGACSACRAPA